MVIHAFVFFKGHDLLRKQRLLRASSCHLHSALVELQSHFAIHFSLGVVNSSLQHLALGAPPVAVVDQLRIAGHQLVFEVRHLAIQSQRLHRTMRFQQDRAARRLIHTTRFHPHIAVLHDVGSAHAVLPADAVQLAQKFGSRHRNAVYRHRIALLKSEHHFSRLIGRGNGRDSPTEHLFGRLQPRVFQNAALI